MKKTNNKGFSLVELIIVVAIMAILIGVLAPQYIKYVEKSRKSADVQLIDAVTTAIQAALTDDDYSGIVSGTNVVTITSTGITTTQTGTTSIEGALNDYFGTGTWGAKKFKSKTMKAVATGVQFDITGDVDKGLTVVVKNVPASLE